MKTDSWFRSFVPVGLLLGLCAATAPAAGQQAAPTAPPQHVTVPSVPGEGNKEGVVNPTGGIQTDAYGNTIQRTGPVTPAGTTQSEPPKKDGAPAKQQQPSAAPPIPAASTIAGPAPSGPAVATGKNVVRIRGVVKAYEAGKSITMTVKGTGKDVTYTLKSGAKVPEGLKVGDYVRLQIQAAEKGKIVDLVEILPKS